MINLWINRHSSLVPKKPTPKYYINGYPAYKKYYLCRDWMTFEEFVDLVDRYIDYTSKSKNQIDQEAFAGSETDFDCYDNEIEAALKVHWKKEAEEFRSLMKDGIIGKVK